MTNICKRCGNIFQNKKQFQDHNKNGKRCMAKSLGPISSSYRQTQSSEPTSEISFEQQAFNSIKNIFLCTIKEWAAKFKQSASIKLNVIITYFLKCLRQLPDLTLSFKDLGDELDWKKYVGSIYDFAHSFQQTERILEKMPKNSRVVARKQLKNVASVYPEIKVGTVKIYRHRQSKVQKLISIDDIGKVIHKFLSSNDKQQRMFGLDFYIAFASGQRIVGELKTLQGEITNFLQTSQQTFKHSERKKRYAQIDIALPKQLIAYLKQYKWSGWAPFTKQSFKRSVNWLGVTIHKLRKAFSRFIGPACSAAQKSLNHRQFQSTTKYAGISVNYVVSMGYFPYLDHCVGQFEFKEGIAMESSLNSDFYDIWRRQRGKKQIVHYDNENSQDVESSEENMEFQIQHKQVENNHLFMQPNEQKTIPQVKQKQILRLENGDGENILINSQVVQLNPSLFQFNGQCIYCRKSFSYPCNCLTSPWVSHQIKMSAKSSQLSIKFPQNYNKLQFSTQYNKIRDIINLRGFAYVEQAYSAEPKLNDLEPFQVSYIPENIAQSFINLTYFPPIQVKKSGTIYKGNDSLGIFAIEDIEADVFIGEYAGDIVEEKHLCATKRQDTIMHIRQSYVIAPIGRMGYVCLINGAEKKPNCSSTQIVINGSLRVIIFSKRKINSGEQLTYQYSDEYFKNSEESSSESWIESCSKVNKKNILTEQLRTELIYQQWEELAMCKQMTQFQTFEYNVQTLTNRGNQCYANSLTQILQPIIQPILGYKQGYNILIKEILENHKGLQQDPAEAFSKLHIPLLQNLLKFFSHLQLSCQKCKKTREVINSEPILQINLEKNVQTSILRSRQKRQQILQCQKCGRTKHKVQQQYFFQQHILVQLKTVQHQRGIGNNKNQIVFKTINQLKYKNYRPIAYLTHYGSTDQGHYTCTIISNKKLYEINDWQIYQQTKIKPSLVLLKQMHDEAGCFIVQRLQSNQLILMNQTSKTVNVASIVKLMLINLVLKHNIQGSFQYSKQLDYYRLNTESSAGLKVGQFYQIDYLLQALGTCSGCDAARLVKSIITSVLGQKVQTIMQRECEQLGIDSSIIGDGVGLQGNLSHTIDIVKVFKQTMLNKSWKKYFTSNSFQNTNKLISKNLVGKTGSASYSYSFVGQKNGLIICVLGAISRDSLWRLLQKIDERSNAIIRERDV